MDKADVLKRLHFDPVADFKRLYRAFQGNADFLVPSNIEDAFTVAREKPEGFRNHRPVLALSFGGSTTAAMLAEIRDGVPLIRHATERRNPCTPEPMDEYFDEVLLGQPAFSEYLKTDEEPVLAIAIAVMIKDGVPYHPSKLATIEGLVATDPVAQAQTHHLGRNIARWLKSRGLKPARIVYAGDAPVAHLGGVGLSPMEPDDRSLLMVCGNGMACADYTRFIVCGMFHCLCEMDAELYPADMTENGQYQYLVAGKGVFKVLRRAAELAGIDASPFLQDNHDSVRVYDLWAGKQTPAMKAMRDTLGEADFQTLQELAAAIVPRGIAVFANSIICSVLLNGSAPSGNPYRLFLEGSIGTDPDVVPVLEQQLQQLLRNRELFAELKVDPPKMPVIARNISAGEWANVDMSLIGALFLGAAKSTDS